MTHDDTTMPTHPRSASDVTTVAVVGGGRMGVGIAHAFILAGRDVVIAERDEGAAAQARAALRKSLHRAADHGTLAGSPDALAARMRTVNDLEYLPGDADLVVEAVPEDPALKREVLAAIEARIREDCAIATNTSSIPVGSLATALRRPGRFLGMHFFNPVPVSSLVEVVVGAETDPAVRDLAVDLVAELGKQAIVVRDSPGFATSRLGVLLGLEAIRMLEEGVADAASIDTAMELGYRHPTGPLRSTDLVGLDVRLAIAEHLYVTLGPRFEPPALLRRKVADGELGRKTGRGFYEWEVRP